MVLLKISQKSQENICTGVSFSVKIQAGGLQLCYKETQYWRLFVNSAKLLKTLFLETSVNGCFLRVRSLRVSIRKSSDFYYAEDCFTYFL